MRKIILALFLSASACNGAGLPNSNADRGTEIDAPSVEAMCKESPDECMTDAECCTKLCVYYDQTDADANVKRCLPEGIDIAGLMDAAAKNAASK